MYIESTARAVAMRSPAWSSAPHAVHQVQHRPPKRGHATPLINHYKMAEHQ